MNDHEVVITTGRKMTQRLQDALDNVGGSEREVTIRAFETAGGRLDALHQALALELRLCQLREQDTLQRMAGDLADDSNDPPLPEATGRAVFIDPDTGELRDADERD